MDMPFKMYHALYRSAWLESTRKAKEAEEAQKQAEAEEKAAKRQSKSGMSSRERLDNIRSKNLGGLDLSGIDMEEAAEELGLT